MTTPRNRHATGSVDFTMMYAAHDAFARDLSRLEVAAAIDGLWDAVARRQWARFVEQLHIHHRAEDASLWPALREKAHLAPEILVLEAMEAEHAEIDPLLTAVAGALAAQDPGELGGQLHRLIQLLGAHLRHEEEDALPLVEQYLGPAGWNRFGQSIRKSLGRKGAATFFPWLLDDAPYETRTHVLGRLPLPLRVMYRRVWLPRYLGHRDGPDRQRSRPSP